eukprot:g17411.t1
MSSLKQYHSRPNVSQFLDHVAKNCHELDESVLEDERGRKVFTRMVVRPKTGVSKEVLSGLSGLIDAVEEKKMAAIMKKKMAAIMKEKWSRGLNDETGGATDEDWFSEADRVRINSMCDVVGSFAQLIAQRQMSAMTADGLKKWCARVDF